MKFRAFSSPKRLKWPVSPQQNDSQPEFYYQLDVFSLFAAADGPHQTSWMKLFLLSHVSPCWRNAAAASWQLLRGSITSWGILSDLSYSGLSERCSFVSLGAGGTWFSLQASFHQLCAFKMIPSTYLQPSKHIIALLWGTDCLFFVSCENNCSESSP